MIRALLSELVVKGSPKEVRLNYTQDTKQHSMESKVDIVVYRIGSNVPQYRVTHYAGMDISRRRDSMVRSSRMIKPSEVTED